MSELQGVSRFTFQEAKLDEFERSCGGVSFFCQFVSMDKTAGGST